MRAAVRPPCAAASRHFDLLLFSLTNWSIITDTIVLKCVILSKKDDGPLENGNIQTRSEPCISSAIPCKSGSVHVIYFSPQYGRSAVLVPNR